ncbi:MAG: hypothetical protein WCG83_06880 [Candidatus Peregrinibacteria bacterium]
MPTVPDLEVEVKTESSKAVITGKTSVPFRTFVGLVLQRKVLQLFKDWGEEPVILSSSLLTNLASAPQDSQENKAHLVTVTLGVGVLLGIFFLAALQAGLLFLHVSLGMREYLLIVGGFAGIGILAVMLQKMQGISRGQKIADTMEKVAGFLSRK